MLAGSERTVVIEGNPYFPPQDVNFDHLENSSRQTVCLWKGTASYYDIVADRYWSPMSQPWRPRVVGLWIRQNVSSSRS